MRPGWIHGLPGSKTVSIPATYLSAESAAALLAESRKRRFQAELRRSLRDRFDALLTDEQRHQRAMFEARARANKLKGSPSIFGGL